MTPKSLKPKISSSRFWVPLPVIMMTAGNGPWPSGRVRVPDSLIAPLFSDTSSALYGMGLALFRIGSRLQRFSAGRQELEGALDPGLKEVAGDVAGGDDAVENGDAGTGHQFEMDLLAFPLQLAQGQLGGHLLRDIDRRLQNAAVLVETDDDAQLLAHDEIAPSQGPLQLLRGDIASGENKESQKRKTRNARIVS